ncbi:MAG: hypothetical protein WCR84_03230 [Candidatus Paceibacterota bacterium]
MKQTKKSLNDFIFSVKQKNKKLKTIISIPRSNSTIIELILSSSSSVSKVIHEPFLDFGYYDAEVFSVYQKISSIINTGNKRRETFLIKEMAHWLIKDNAYKVFLKSVDKPVILLIKNPYLSIESKIRKILQGADRKNRPDLAKILSTSMFQQKNKNIRDSRDGLNFFAKERRYNSWAKLVEEEAIQKRNFTMFNLVVKYFVKNSAEDIWGWKNIDEIRKFLDKNEMKYKILEGVDFQLAPEATIYGLCKVLNINFDKKMLYCSEKKFNKLIKQISPHSILWYEKVLSSQEIIKPNISPLSINKFPSCVQKYLSNIALPIYRQLCLSQHRLDVLSYSTNLKHDRISFQNYKTIDPIYFAANKHIKCF